MLRVSFVRLSAAKAQIAIIGSGPSGCYTADHLIKKGGDNIHIDIYDRMPVPFGLVRYGVAPDHPEVKNVEDRFLKMLTGANDKVTWLGNIDVGRALSVQQLQACYDAVIFATGADNDNKLRIPKEDLANIFSARTFVNYYNTMPAPYANSMSCPFDITQTKRAVIIGNGNVALDVARALAAPYKHWCPTDMNCRAIRDLMNSAIEQIDIIARRGEESAAFTTSEFREIATTFAAADVEVRLRDFDVVDVLRRSDGSRARKRMIELMHKFTDAGRAATAAAASSTSASSSTDAKESATPGAGAQQKSSRKRIINFYFNMKPTAFVSKESRPNFVGGVLFDRVNPTTGEVSNVMVPADVVFTSIGYRSEPVRGVPFDSTRGVIPNISGRVCHAPTAEEVPAKDLIIPNLYCVGWVKRGPKGVILHAMMDAQETASKVLEDLAIGKDTKKETVEAPVGGEPSNPARPASTDNVATEPNTLNVEEEQIAAPAQSSKRGKYDLLDYLVAKELIPVSIKGAQRVFAAEKNKGVDLGKRLEKIGSVTQMIQIASGGKVGVEASRQFRGMSGARPPAADMLAAFLDDETDMRPIAKGFSKSMPHVMANTKFHDGVADKSK